MSTETELKLALPAQALGEAERLPWLRKLATARLPQSSVRSVYFDTKKQKLRRHDLTLRLRKQGAKRLQTIKLANATAEPLGRSEWEEEIESRRPDLKRAKGTPLAPLIGRKFKKRLRPVFKTEVRRRVMNIHLNGSEIELAFDHGRIVAGRRSAPICELELELKRGDLSDLAALARRLGRGLPLAFAARSKPDRGYSLRAGEEHAAIRGTDIVLTPSQSAGTAFRQIGLSCLQHVAANQEAVEAGDGEGIHQMRVGLRRLRAAISLFGFMLAGEETESIKAELKWLTQQLGPARDLDVMAKKAVAPLRAENPDQPEIEVLEQDVKRQRDDKIERARAAARSERYRRLVLTTALWLIDGTWSRAPQDRGRDRAIDPVAAEILDRRSRKVVKRAKRLHELDAARRHKLRIAIKKLRYACAFFESLYGHPKRQKRFGKLLSDLQDSLGTLNDIAVHASRAHELADPRQRSPRQPQKAYAMGFLTAREKAEARALEGAAAKSGKKLAAANRFW